MGQKNFPFIHCAVCLVFASYMGLRASEDTLELNEETPQTNTQALNSPSTYAMHDSISLLTPTDLAHLDTSSHFSQAFRWIYSTVFITAYFGDGTLKEGFALLLKDGFYLTSSELTFTEGLYPQKILARMQDDSAKPLICIAQLQLKALDSTKGLALLKTSAFTDDYCNTRPESYYHKRIYEKYAQAIFSPTPTKKLILGGLYYPVLQDSDTFGIRRTIPIKEESHYDGTLAKKVSYGYSLPNTSGQAPIFGKPYFNKDGEFLGIFSIASSSVPILIKKEIIQEFICNLKKKNIFAPKNSGCQGGTS
ncbi:hypothetical protein BKH46_00970 [Helicobacter sp. 12S02634-8]|uniref:hypothetical protein n=1 Tax=Helicobacter sp. 12S02634-8 TaxID=1476199 RepID=UPI000BA519D3|nr:hypothetical protein [Helicobacter sp. 12S02634-8]PAF48508.1 hypothetical protein BKH46_00970 [Helicobacter sp. 12S02634-8]